MSEFAVVGLGRFGRSVVRSLSMEGFDVLAVDRDPARLKLVEREAVATLCLDVTDEDSMATMPLARALTVVVAIGSRAREASLLAVAVLKEFGVPRIVARAFDPSHARLLRELGARQVVHPEEEMAQALSLRLAHPEISGWLRVGGERVAEVELPEAFAGSTLDELRLREEYGVEVLVLHRQDETISHPGGDERLSSGDRAVLLGSFDSIGRIADLA